MHLDYRNELDLMLYQIEQKNLITICGIILYLDQAGLLLLEIFVGYSNEIYTANTLLESERDYVNARLVYIVIHKYFVPHLNNNWIYLI